MVFSRRTNCWGDMYHLLLKGRWKAGASNITVARPLVASFHDVVENGKFKFLISCNVVKI